MADVWSPWVKNEYNFRCMLRYSTSTSADRVTASLEGWSQSAQTTINYGKSVLEWTEDGSNFTNMADVYPSALSRGATVRNSSSSDWWTRVYGRDRHIYLQHWFSSPGSSIGEYVTGARAGATITIPARAYERPHAPASPSLVRNSDTSVTLAWKADYTSSSEAYPWTGVNVYRKVDGGSWSRIAQLSWDKTGYTDAGTSANHRYDYMVRSYNGSGESADAFCGTVRMTPSAPAGVSVTRTAAVTFSVGAASGSNWGNSATKVEVAVSVDGAGYKTISDTVAVGGTVSYSGAANHRYQFAARACGSSSWGAWSYSYVAYTAPSAPSGVSAARSSDASQKVSWSLGANAANCWQGAFVQRSVDGGQWQTVATLSGTPINYTDNGTSADHSYRYRVAGYNSYETSGWVESGTVYTTPRAPSLVSAAATGPTSVSVTASGLSSVAASFEVQHRAGASGEWGETKTVASFPAEMASVAGENFYRVRAVRGSLASAWTASDGVTTVARPLAPTVTGVSLRYATGSAATVAWVPNHPDGSAQVAAEVELTDQSGKASLVNVSGAATSYASGALSKGHWSVRVRTRGAWDEGDGWGEWSQPTAFDVYDPAVVSFSSPAAGSSVDRVPVTVAWSVADETGVASQTVEVLAADGSVLWSQTLAGTERSVLLGQSTFMPQNRASYVVRITVWAGSGLSVAAELPFSTLWSAPDLATASITHDGGEAAHVLVSFGSAEGLPATVSVDCERVLADGSSLVLATGMADGEEVIDRLPPLNRTCRYRLTAHSEAGTTSVSECSAYARCADAVLSFGADAAAYVRCAYNPSLSHSYARSVEYLHFADGGEAGGLPVAYGLDERDRSVKLGWDVTDFEAADGLARSEYDCWLRLPTGQRGRYGVQWSIDRKAPGLWTVSASLTETQWEEPELG